MDIQAELEKIARIYEEDKAVEDSFNALIYGDLGTYKTSFITTGRRPILIHSFDRGGTKIPEVRQGIEEGWCFVETFETDDWRAPKQYDRWDRRFKELTRGDFFNGIGTFAIDSISMWLRTMMNKRVHSKRDKRDESIPAIQDYLVVANELINNLIIMNSLPCDTIVIGHIDRHEDKITGAVQTSIDVFRSLKNFVPKLFDEVYVTMVHKTANATPEVKLLTANDGRYKAKTRIGGHGIFDHEEVMNIKHLLKKAGRSTEDKS